MAIKIFIDQGHNPIGYYNTGAEGNGYYEQDITYRVGILLLNMFNNNPGYEAIVSRQTQDTVLGSSNSTSLSERARLANSYGADLFISLHTNASVNSVANGSECLVYNSSSTVAIAIGENILEEITRLTDFRNRGIVYRPGLYVLKRTAMPAIVVEMGFITNPENARVMVESPELFATGIYRGVTDYYNVN